LEAVVGATSGMISAEPQVLFDMLMLTGTEGAERNNEEWEKLFTQAGFSSYKIIHTVGFMSIIEIYP
jgi:trans-resveratrol di-O-methyltransferase